MRIDVYKMFYENYKFSVELDTGAELGSYQLTLWYAEKLPLDNEFFSPWQVLRSFYFEEVNESYIRVFCHKFSFDVTYRQDVHAVQVHWARRNALFERNLLSIVGETTLLASDGVYYQKARALFRWLDVHVTAIMALPAYKNLQMLDGIHSAQADTDFAILPAIELLRQVPGISIQAFCQGVSGKIAFQGYELLALSGHDEYAYVAFTTLTTLAHDIIVSLLPAYPTITTLRVPCNFSLRLVLRSTGDNIRFRVELLSLAREALTLIQQQAITSAVDQTFLHHDWQYSLYPARCPTCSDPGGILPSRLHWLCLPSQIEQTLALIFHLNYWLYASDALFYADRHGLAEVKATVLQQAYLAGALLPVTYIDGTTTFAYDYMCELAVDLATEAFVVRLSSLFTPEASDAVDDEWDATAHRLFVNIMGRPAIRVTDIDTLDMLQIGKYIATQLEILIQRARASRLPIPAHELAALFIEPTDLLDLYAHRNRTWLSWQDLDTEELSRLDPEGQSLVAFQYHSLHSTYSFHLPLRVAEAFISAQYLSLLKQQPGHGKEYAIIAGEVVTDATSQLHSIQSILSALLVDVSTLCPHKLVYKTALLPWGGQFKQSIWEDDLSAN